MYRSRKLADLFNEQMVKHVPAKTQAGVFIFSSFAEPHRCVRSPSVFSRRSDQFRGFQSADTLNISRSPDFQNGSISRVFGKLVENSTIHSSTKVQPPPPWYKKLPSLVQTLKFLNFLGAKRDPESFLSMRFLPPL